MKTKYYLVITVAAALLFSAYRELPQLLKDISDGKVSHAASIIAFTINSVIGVINFAMSPSGLIIILVLSLALVKKFAWGEKPTPTTSRPHSADIQQ